MHGEYQHFVLNNLYIKGFRLHILAFLWCIYLDTEEFIIYVRGTLFTLLIISSHNALNRHSSSSKLVLLGFFFCALDIFYKARQKC